MGLSVAATVALFVVSRGKWSDALIDSGNEWIVPDTLARGGLLYRDVVFWFGPFEPYWHSLFFRLAGSSFRTLALAGAASSIGILYCLRLALRLVTDARQANAWAIVAIPWLIFMPDAGGAILGMGYRMWYAAAFGLLALTAAIRRPGARGLDVAAGLAAGAAGLCRTEWGAAVLVGVGVAVVLRSAGRPPWSALARVGAGFVTVFAGGLGYFLLRASPAALLRDSPVLLFNLPAETRANVAAPHPSAWAAGLVQMAYCAFAWLGLLVVLEILIRARREPGFGRRRLPVLAALLLLTAGCAAIAGLPNDVLLAGTPLLCAASVLVALKTPRGRLAAVLGGFGILGVLAAHRRPFFIGDGPYVAPPVLFAIVCAAGCLARALMARDDGARVALSAWVHRGVLALAAVLFAARLFHYAQDDRVAVAGTGGMLSARPETARRIEVVAEEIRRKSSPGEGLVVFPEGEILNFLSGRPNPIRHKLYLPGYLNRENEAEVLAELVAARPGAIVIWPRQLAEYGGASFGVDYGASLRAWIRANYSEALVRVGSGQAPLLAIRQPEAR